MLLEVMNDFSIIYTPSARRSSAFLIAQHLIPYNNVDLLTTL
jgi:hypothetical protein